MQLALLGPEFSDADIEVILRANGAVFQKLDRSSLLDFTVDLLKTEKVIGWFQGRMEFGPRAPGSRSIIGDARSPKMQSVMNLKVKSSPRIVPALCPNRPPGTSGRLF